VEINLELLKPFGIVPQVTVPKLSIERSQGKEKPVVALHPGGYYDTQKWDAARFGLLAKMIAEKYKAAVMIIGGSGDMESVKKVLEAAGLADTAALFPGMEELTKTLSGCDLLICNNSGPLHLAAALGVPTISMMGPTDPVLWWPKGDNQVVIRKGVKCSPCSLGRCEEHLCMDLITVDEVFDEARKLLEKVYGLKG